MTLASPQQSSESHNEEQDMIRLHDFAAMKEFPYLAEINDMDDEQRSQAFTAVLNDLQNRLDDVTE